MQLVLILQDHLCYQPLYPVLVKLLLQGLLNGVKVRTIRRYEVDYCTHLLGHFLDPVDMVYEATLWPSKGIMCGSNDDSTKF